MRKEVFSSTDVLILVSIAATPFMIYLAYFTEEDGSAMGFLGFTIIKLLRLIRTQIKPSYYFIYPIHEIKEKTRQNGLK